MEIKERRFIYKQRLRTRNVKCSETICQRIQLNGKTKIVVENRKTKLMKFMKSHDIKDFIEFRKAKALARKVIKLKKKENLKK